VNPDLCAAVELKVRPLQLFRDVVPSSMDTIRFYQFYCMLVVKCHLL
jgi:hypothetical protein